MIAATKTTAANKPTTIDLGNFTRPPVTVLPDSTMVEPAVDQMERRPLPVICPMPIRPPQKQTPAAAIEKAALTALLGGYQSVAAKVDELKHTLTVARLTQEGHDAIQNQIVVLEALAGGKPGLEDKSKSLQRLLMVAMMDERGYHNITTQIEALNNVAKAFNPLEKRMGAIDSIKMRARLTPDAVMSLDAERRALKAFVHGGKVVESEIADIENTLRSGLFAPELKDRLTLELSALLGVRGGLTGVRERANEVRHLMTVARFDQSGYQSVQRELNTLEALAKTLATFEKRVGKLG